MTNRLQALVPAVFQPIDLANDGLPSQGSRTQKLTTAAAVTSALLLVVLIVILMGMT
ncbi:MAG TPA: hypothetical protein VHD59_02565 [Pseudolabrys sp.]|nr:hypothetical protein [Pseudolabrys sp.]